MIKMRENVTPGETPAEITVSMIDQDLKDGISKPEMATKYGIKPWEVDEMFKHPLLKGRRPSRKKTLSFSKNQMQETQEAIVEILSPTEYETPEETLLKAAQDTENEVIEELNLEEEEDGTFEL